ncbi:hypothetical protein [Carboxylicivirga sp. M1479]|uniref:hypothetical protein n=1 Tax=Carboxylicivirga sp. M1479 TaxID=2594476 RepID=UPI001177EF19|nr:hypothetical protein [Carboxylicivirga sp. M1479]TRX72422.1 hypothetical protein FNN09_00350 [Carboxylicivirga sp. M1479]
MYKLNEKDRKALKYQCRPAIILPIISSGLIPLITVLVVLVQQIPLRPQQPLFAFLLQLPVVVLIAYFKSRKYIEDLKANSKRGVVKYVQRKQSKDDFNDENGVGYRGLKYRAFDDFAIIVEDVRYGVSKKLFDSLKSGDPVVFYYAPVSNMRLGIERKK